MLSDGIWDLELDSKSKEDRSPGPLRLRGQKLDRKKALAHGDP